MSRAEIDQIAAAYLHELMAEDEEMRVEGLTRGEYRSADETVAIVLPEAKRDDAIGHVEPYRDESDDWLVSNGHRIDPKAPVYREVLHRMLRECGSHLNAVAERQAGNFVETPPAPSPVKAGPTLRELIDAYLNDPAASRNSKTLMTYRIVFDALAEIVGEAKPAREITREDCERVRDVLLKLPSNARKKYPDVPWLTAVELGAKDGARPRHGQQLPQQSGGLVQLGHGDVARGAQPCKGPICPRSRASRKEARRLPAGRPPEAVSIPTLHRLR